MILTGPIFEIGTYGVPSKSQKLFICGGVGQTIKLPNVSKIFSGSEKGKKSYQGFLKDIKARSQKSGICVFKYPTLL